MLRAYDVNRERSRKRLLRHLKKSGERNPKPTEPVARAQNFLNHRRPPQQHSRQQYSKKSFNVLRNRSKFAGRTDAPIEQKVKSPMHTNKDRLHNP